MARRAWVSRVTLVVLLLAGAVAGAPAQQRAVYEELQAFSALLNQIRLNYVDSVRYRRLVRAAIDGVLRSLDPHSYYLSPEEVARQTALERGELGSVGLQLEDVDGLITVLTVAEHGPADDKGVLPGDRLRRLDGALLAGAEPREVELRLAGPTGSRVAVLLERGPRFQPERFMVTLTRERVEHPAVGVRGMVDERTGHVRLASFRGEAARELETAVQELLRRGAERLILDLRGNPGGRVAAAVEVAGLFFPRNTLIFRTRSRRTGETPRVTTRNGPFVELPLIALVDERSASAAEALAGSLQDHDRALIIGRRTFGKALIQTAFPLPGGDIVWLTTGHVLTPSGRFIQRAYRGITREQYLREAGEPGVAQDTLAEFRTDAGRMVRGGGGIVPDVELPLPALLPVWVSVAADSGWDVAVADSVAFTLDESPDSLRAWMADPERWRRQLLAPFLERAGRRLGVSPQRGDSRMEPVTWRLAARTTAVRWGREAAERLVLEWDPALGVALAHFRDLDALLASPRE